MSQNYISQIDELLDEELPDNSTEDDRDVEEEQKDEIIEALQHAADKLGKSPTIREFRELELEASTSDISRVFGTWNAAKRAAGLETRQRGTVVDINENYFKNIDTTGKAYWLGTLFAHSSLHVNNQENSYTLILGRAESYEYFVRGFADSVGSDYPIRTHTKADRPHEESTISTRISNPSFIRHLTSAGYPKPDDPVGGFPLLSEEYLVPFVRGYLESAGYFSTGGWHINADSLSRAYTFQHLFEKAGAKRPTLSTDEDNGATVRVSNVFDIRAVFETLWPDQLETAPSWTPYPEKVISHLEQEYPYPENVSYLPE